MAKKEGLNNKEEYQDDMGKKRGKDWFKSINWSKNINIGLMTMAGILILILIIWLFKGVK